MSRIKVDVDAVMAAERIRDEIKNLDINDVSFIVGGKEIFMQPHVMAEWKYSGLNLVTFIKCRDW